MTRKRFNILRSRLEMRERKSGSMKPRNETEKFVAEVIEEKRKLYEKVEKYIEK